MTGRNEPAGAIAASDLDPRVAESLPWMAVRYADMDWNWLVRNVKLADRQNRLGFVVTLAKQLAEHERRREAQAALSAVEQALERSRLAHEDTLAHDSMTRVEREWLRQNRSPDAVHWNLLTDMSVEYLSHATK